MPMLAQTSRGILAVANSFAQQLHLATHHRIEPGPSGVPKLYIQVIGWLVRLCLCLNSMGIGYQPICKTYVQESIAYLNENSWICASLLDILQNVPVKAADPVGYLFHSGIWKHSAIDVCKKPVFNKKVFIQKNMIQFTKQ